MLLKFQVSKAIFYLIIRLAWFSRKDLYVFQASVLLLFYYYFVFGKNSEVFAIWGLKKFMLQSFCWCIMIVVINMSNILKVSSVKPHLILSFVSPCIIIHSNESTNQMHQSLRCNTCRLKTAQPVPDILMPIIRSSTTAVAASGFTVGAWW
jgi:hypothetical protein